MSAWMHAVAALVVLGVVSGASAQAAGVPRMGVDFTFEAKHKCQGVSPEIRLSEVPAGVASFQVSMTDRDVPTFRHWEQTLRASGPLIGEGAGRGYYGPCPPSGTHRYTIAVTALDAQKKPVAYGEKTVDAGR